MVLIRWFVNFISGAIAALTFFYLVISICVLGFKHTGILVDGPMYFDLQTPTYSALLTFQAACTGILAACFTLRMTIGKKNDLEFLRRRRRQQE